jgi:hypothetical protein
MISIQLMASSAELGIANKLGKQIKFINLNENMCAYDIFQRKIGCGTI